MSGGGDAYAYHSDLSEATRKTLDELASLTTLVICHNGYARGLNALALDTMYPAFEKFHAFNGGRRHLVIVDEALDQVVDERVPRRLLKQLLADLPAAVEREHPAGVR